MANSITLSTALVSDIQSKITAGTATAEEVVLYTKGLNQLQTGNDFQSLVVGLSQSAVDAIDSANAQFQEDAQNALNTFAQTATNIDTSAATAVSAINTAKNTLNSTSTAIDTRLASIENIVPTISKISDETTWIVGQSKIYVSNMGTHEMVHPYDFPAFLLKEAYTNNTQANISTVNHWGEVLDDAFIHNYEFNSYNDAAIQMHQGNMYHYYIHSNYEYLLNNDAPGTGASYERWSYTNFNDNLGSSYMRNWFVEKKGGHPRNWTQSSIETSWDLGKQTGLILNDPGQREWVIRRTDGRWMQLFSHRFPHLAVSRNRIYYQGESPTRNYGPVDNNEIEFKMYSEAMFGNGWTTGYNGICYNKKLGKMVAMRSDWAETGTGAYRMTPYQFSFVGNFDLEQVAKGKQELAVNQEDLIGTGKMVEDFHKSTNVFDNVGDGTGWIKYGYENNPGTGNQAEDRYRSHVILCDNNDLISVHFIPTKGLQLIRHTYSDTGGVKDWTTTKWTNLQSHATTYGVGQSWATGINAITSNDGRYVMVGSPYYSYASGNMFFLIRVSDGKYLHYRNTNTSRGYGWFPFRNNNFYWGTSRETDNSIHVINCDVVFGYKDETPNSGTNPTDTIAWSDSNEMFMMPHVGTAYKGRTYSWIPNYFNNRRMVTYYNNDGSYKSDLYDKYGNSLT